MSRKDKKKKQPPHDRKKDDKKEGKENKQEGETKSKIVFVPKKIVTRFTLKPTPDRMKQPSIISAFQPRKRCLSPTVVTISDDEEAPAIEEPAVTAVTGKDSHDSQQPHCSHSLPQIMTPPSSLVIKLPSDPTQYAMDGLKMSVQNFQSTMEDLKAIFPLQWNVKLQRNTLHHTFQNLFGYTTGSPFIPLTCHGLCKMLKWTQEWRKINETAGHGDREYRSLLTSYLLQKKKRHTRHFRVVGQDEEDDDEVSHVSETPPNSPEIYEKMVMSNEQEGWAAYDDLETPGSLSMMRDFIPKVMQIQADFVSELQPILTKCRNEKRQLLNESDKKEIRATGITLDLKTVDDLKLLLFHSGEWDHEPGYDNQSFQLPTQYLRPTKYGLTNLPTYLLMCSYENETWSTVEATALGEISSSSVAVRFGLSEESLRRSHPAHLGFYWMKAKSCNTDDSCQSVVPPTNDMTASSSLDAAYSVVRPAIDIGDGVDFEPTDKVDDHESEPLIDPFEYFYTQNNDEDEEVIADDPYSDGGEESDDPYSDGGEESDEDMGQVTNSEKVNKEDDKPVQSPEKVTELCAEYTASLHPIAPIWGESLSQCKKRLEIVYYSDPKYRKGSGGNHQSMKKFISSHSPRFRSTIYVMSGRFTEPVFSENVDEVVKNEIVTAGSPLMPATNYDVACIGAWTFNWINKAGSYVSRCNSYNGYMHLMRRLTKADQTQMEKTHWYDGTPYHDIRPRGGGGGGNGPMENDVQIWQDTEHVTNNEKVNKEDDKPAQSPEKVTELCAEYTASLHPRAPIWGKSLAQYKKRLEIVYYSDPKYQKGSGGNHQSMKRFIALNSPRFRWNPIYVMTGRFTEPVFSKNVDEVVKNEIVTAGSPLMPATNYDVACIGAWTFNWINKAGSFVSLCNSYNGYMHFMWRLTKARQTQMEKTHWNDGTPYHDIRPRGGGGGGNGPVMENDVQIWQGEISSEPQVKNENLQTPIQPIHQTSSNKSIPGTRFHTKWLTSPVTSKLCHNSNGSSQVRPGTIISGAIKQLKATLQYTGSDCEFKNSPILKKFMNSDKTVSILGKQEKQVTVTGMQGYVRIRETVRSTRVCTDMTCWRTAYGYGSKCWKHSENVKCLLIHDVNNISIKVFALVAEHKNTRYNNEDKRISVILRRRISFGGSLANYICNREKMGFIPEWRMVCESEELSHKELEKLKNEKIIILDIFFAHHNSRCALDSKMTLLNERVSMEDIDLAAVKHGLDEMGLKFTEGGESDLGLVNWHPATPKGYQVHQQDRLVYIRFGLPGQLYGGKHSVNLQSTGSKRYMAGHHSDCYKDLPVHRSLSKNITTATREMQRREGALQMCILICEMNGSRIDGIPIQRDFKILECFDLWTKEDAVWFGEMHQFLTGRDINAEFTKPVDINNFKW